MNLTMSMTRNSNEWMPVKSTGKFEDNIQDTSEAGSTFFIVNRILLYILSKLPFGHYFQTANHMQFSFS